MQDYLTKFKIKDAQLLFKLRSRMINVRANFRTYYDGMDISCKICQKETEETQAHLLDCETLMNNFKDLYNDCYTEYEDIFEDPEKQLTVTKLFQAVLDTRETLLEEDC